MVKKNIKLNYIYNVAYQILLIAIPFITLPYLSRILGADGIGTFSFAESIVSYFTLFANLGINIYGQREISYVQDDIKKRSLVFFNTLLLKILICVPVSLIYVVFSLTVLKSTIYLILVINLLTTLFDISWFFQGIEEFGKIVSLNTLFRILQVLAIFYFVKTKSDIFLYTFIYALAPLLANLFLYIYLGKFIEKVSLKKLTPFKNIDVAFSLFIPTVAIQIYTVLDKTMIGLITNDAAENGYYELAIKSSKMILTIVTALGIVIVPRIGYYFEKKDKKNINILMYKSYEFVWFLALPLAFGFYMVSSNFVPWYFGEGYEKVIDLIKILTFLIPVIGISNVTGIQYLVPTKRQNILTLTVCSGAILNFVLNMVLIRYFKSIGASIASVAAELFISLLQIYFVRNEISPIKILLSAKYYLLSSCFMVIVLSVLNKILSQSLLSIAVMIIVGGISYIIPLNIFMNRRSFFSLFTFHDK